MVTSDISLVGSGSVAIPSYKSHQLLGDPITDDPLRSGPIFEASWTHALHCVSYLPISDTESLTDLTALLLGRLVPSIDRQWTEPRRQPSSRGTLFRVLA